MERAQSGDPAFVIEFVVNKGVGRFIASPQLFERAALVVRRLFLDVRFFRIGRRCLLARFRAGSGAGEATGGPTTGRAGEAGHEENGWSKAEHWQANGMSWAVSEVLFQGVLRLPAWFRVDGS